MRKNRTMRQNERIVLPALPEKWTDLSTKELEGVAKLDVLRAMELRTSAEGAADRRFKLRCFLLFLNLKTARKAVKGEDGEWRYLFRRKGLRYLTELIPLRAWQVNQWIDDKLKFLDNPYKLYSSPYPKVRLWGGLVCMKGPADLMGDVTFQQYLTAQNIVDAYWNTVNLIQTLEREGTEKAIREQVKRMRKLKRRFLAAMCCRPVKETGEIREGRYVRSKKRTVYAYSEGQHVRNEKFFRGVEDRMFPVMLQFFQSVQEYYASIYPDLYTGHRSGKKSYSQLKVEVEMVNNVMKYQGFSDYDAVYDAEAVRILGIMNAMNMEAKEIEKINKRMKAK